MMSLRTLVAALLLLAVANAFTPVSRPAFGVKTTALQFGFLKDLGIEKPTWLPDFGGKKEEEEAPAPAAEETEGEGDTEEAAAEE
jgi:hypothetical protein